MKGKAILAFSGGLDTSVVIKYLQEKHNLDVVTVTVDVGQEDNLKKISAKAKSLGVLKHYNIDARQEFVDSFIFPAIKANALYQKKYCLASALARPLIAQKVVEVAKKESATALAHGCTGKGNDQVRFDVTYRSGSNLPIIAPIRDLNLTRDVELKYAQKHNIPIETAAAGSGESLHRDRQYAGESPWPHRPWSGVDESFLALFDVEHCVRQHTGHDGAGS